MTVRWTDYLRAQFSLLTAQLGFSPNVTNAGRTQADIEDLRRRGYTPASNSFHLFSNGAQSLDLTPPRGMSMSQLFGSLQGSGINFQELINEGDHVHVTFPEGGLTPGTPEYADQSLMGQFLRSIGGTSFGQGAQCLANPNSPGCRDAIRATPGGGLVNAAAAPTRLMQEEGLDGLIKRIALIALGVGIILGALFLLGSQNKVIQQVATAAKGG